MTRIEDIQTGIWADDDVRALSPHAKLLYFWTFTNSLCNPAGLYRAGRGVIAEQTGLTAAELQVACSELEAARFVLFEGDYLWVRSRVANYRSRGSNIARSIANSVGRLHYKHPLRVAFLFEYEGEDWLADALEPLILQENSDPDLGAAIELLSALLADGPMPSREVMKAAKDASISQSLLRKAKADLDIQSDQSPAGWAWILPARSDDDLALDSQASRARKGAKEALQGVVRVPGEGEGDRERTSTTESTATSNPSSVDEKFSVHSARKNSSVKTEAARRMVESESSAGKAHLLNSQWLSTVVPEVMKTDGTADPRVTVWLDLVKGSDRGRKAMRDRGWVRSAVANTWPEYAEQIRRNDEENNNAA